MLRAVAGRVVHFHAKDLREGKCVALGAGEVDNKSCTAVLREHGYQGALSLETEGEGDSEDCQRLVEMSRAYLKKVLEELSEESEASA